MSHIDRLKKSGVLKFALSFCALILLLSVCVSYIRFLGYTPWYHSDFVSFFSSAKLYISDRNNLYDVLHQMQFQQNLLQKYAPKYTSLPYLPFVNPPFVLLPFLAVTLFPPKTAYSVLVMIGLMLLTLCFLALAKFFPQQDTKRTYWLYLLGLSSMPAYLALYQTQNSVFILSIIILTYALLIKKLHVAAGLVGSMLLAKPQLAILFFIFLFLNKSKKTLIGLIAGSFAVLCINLLITGTIWQPYITINLWYGTLWERLQEPVVSMISWQGFFDQIGAIIPSFPVILIATAVSIITYGLCVAVLIRLKDDTRRLSLAFCIIICGTLLSAMHVHKHDAILLVFVLFRFALKSPSSRFTLFTGLGWLILLLSYFSPWYPNPLFFLPTLYIAGLLGICIREAYTCHG